MPAQSGGKKSAGTGSVPCEHCHELAKPSEIGTHRCAADPVIATVIAAYGEMTWGAKLKDAQDGVQRAYSRRETVFREATAAGFTRRDIADAAGLSAAQVQKVVGKTGRRKRDLNERAA